MSSSSEKRVIPQESNPEPKRQKLNEVEEVKVDEIKEDKESTEVFVGWEKTFFRTYCIRSNDNKLFWCSGDVLVTKSKLIHQMLLDGDELCMSGHEIPLDIHSSFMSIILQYFYGMGFPSESEKFDIFFRLNILRTLIYLNEKTFQEQVVQLIKKDQSILSLRQIDRLPNEIFHEREDLIRFFLRRTIKYHFPFLITGALISPSIKWKKNSKDLVIPKKINRKTLNLFIEESMNKETYIR